MSPLTLPTSSKRSATPHRDGFQAQGWQVVLPGDWPVPSKHNNRNSMRYMGESKKDATLFRPYFEHWTAVGFCFPFLGRPAWAGVVLLVPQPLSEQTCFRCSVAARKAQRCWKITGGRANLKRWVNESAGSMPLPEDLPETCRGGLFRMRPRLLREPEQQCGPT